MFDEVNMRLRFYFRNGRRHRLATARTALNRDSRKAKESNLYHSRTGPCVLEFPEAASLLGFHAFK
jgi:hypothetical protein